MPRDMTLSIKIINCTVQFYQVSCPSDSFKLSSIVVKLQHCSSEIYPVSDFIGGKLQKQTEYNELLQTGKENKTMFSTMEMFAGIKLTTVICRYRSFYSRRVCTVA